MLFDFNEAWPRVAEAQYDVCVCGAGPAGITIARKLAARGKKVLLLEAGGLSYSNESQDQSWLGKSGQRDKWSFCLIAAMMPANRRDNEQTTAPEPHTGIQVEGGSGRHQGR